MMKGKQGNKKKTKVACANLANLGASGASKVNSFGAELEPIGQENPILRKALPKGKKNNNQNACGGGGVKAFFKIGSVW
ncbi:hypothetical protein F383_07281 [Gossypium arboreum]|uniref:Uncharacterized protein n=1 Tax=Gossypium arboreum TaxID=29729 RepID=A0A0B0P4F3_GOSAR|nr:hypothetical protein F383_07281 [Gossypium arboreum]